MTSQHEALHELSQELRSCRLLTRETMALDNGTYLADAGIAPSVGSQGDAFDNARAESVIALFKTEVI